MRLNGAVCGILVFAASGLSCSDSSQKAPPGAPTNQKHSIYVTRAMAEGGIVTSTDSDGVPRFIWASRKQKATAGVSTEVAAKEHFVRFAPAYGLADARGMSVASVGRTPKGQYVVKLRQRLDGIDIHRGGIKLLLAKDRSLMALTGTPSRVLGAKTRTFALSPGQALARALRDLYGMSVPDGQPIGINPDAPTVRLTLPGASRVVLSEPARAKKVFVAQGDQLVPAYFIEFFSSDSQTVVSDAFSYVIAASSGTVLEKHNLTHDVAFNYRVFADDTGDFRPFDGPQESWTPHPTGVPDNSDPPFADPNVVTVETIKTLPTGQVDPWLAANAVQTQGNNADAYADLSAPDGFSNGDLRATLTDPETFDRTYDTGVEPGSSDDQKMASVTHLFFMINWLHDYWYDSGFNEAAGNAQTNNFGRGGLGSDPINAEAQDFFGFNNANMSTPSDGLRPRMQMFLFLPRSLSGLEINPGGLTFPTGTASFGQLFFDLTAPVVLVDDGVADPSTSNGCTPIMNNVSGSIALIDRGVCGFVVKAANAQAAGAVGMLVVNNAAGAPPPALGGADPAVTIPALSVTLEDGTTIKTLLQSGPVTASMDRTPIEPFRDGSLDNMVVAHEWGHYFHHRLQQCGTVQCAAQSEGWGDFLGLHTILRDGDNLDGTYGMGIYAPRSFGDSGFFGIRRFAYSVDPTKNGLSFRHIEPGQPLPATPTNGVPPTAQNSEVHNAGEVWASMLFEAYVALHKNPGARSFDDVRRDFADYVTLGLQLTPDDATFTETRDGILAAILVLNPDDVNLVATAFATRGAGTCAISPPRDAPLNDLSGVTESDVVGGITEITSIELDDTVDSCDNDGYLDADETGALVIGVANRGPVPLTGVDVTVSTTTAGATFPGGTTFSIGDLPPFGTATVTFQVALDNTIVDTGLLDLTVTVDSDNGCTASVASTINPRIHADETPNTSATENVEAVNPPWSRTGTFDNLWSRIETAPGEHVFHGTDSGTTTDAQLTSPPLTVSAADPFTITFEHTYQFEADFDGGVIEFSTDGINWLDIATLGVDPGYTGVLVPGSPLEGRNTYTGDSPSLPDADTVSLDLGIQLAGQTVQIRFRIGTDGGVGAPGWNIDNIAFGGITNTPFTTIIDHAAVCQLPPIANAGPDRTVESGADVILSAAASTDPNGDPLTFLWTQSSGTGVTLLNPANVTTAFVAPTVAADEDLVFNVQVSDPFAESNDSVTIRVLAPVVDPPDAGPADASPPEPDAGEEIDAAPRPDARDDTDDDDDDDDDGGCRVAGGNGGGATFALMLGLAVLAVTRRRRR